MSEIEQPGPDFSGSGPVAYGAAAGDPRTAQLGAIADEEARLLAIPGVVSVGMGQGAPGTRTIMIGVTDAGVAARLPREINGLAVVVSVIGTVDAQRQD